MQFKYLLIRQLHQFLLVDGHHAANVSTLTVYVLKTQLNVVQ